MKGQKINIKNLVPFFMSLNPPLGLGKNLERTEVANKVVKMKLHGYILVNK